MKMLFRIIRRGLFNNIHDHGSRQSSTQFLNLQFELLVTVIIYNLYFIMLTHAWKIKQINLASSVQMFWVFYKLRFATIVKH